MFKRLGELLFNVITFPIRLVKRLFAKRKPKKGIFPIDDIETIVKRLKNENIEIVYELEDISIKINHKPIEKKEDKKKETKKETKKKEVS